jgi:hypothetical protein
LGVDNRGVGVLTADLAEIAPTVRDDWRKAFLNIFDRIYGVKERGKVVKVN